MADVVKKLDRGIEPNARYQVFTQADGGTGDVLLIQDSLGHPGSNLNIDATDELTIRLNVYRILYQRRDENDCFIDAQNKNIAQGTRAKSDSNPTITIAAGDSLTFNNEITIYDIEIVAAAGSYSMLVS